MKLQRGDFVAVTWIDAESIDEWTPFSAIDDLLPAIISVGVVILHGKHILVVGLNADAKNDNYSCIMKIPKGMITHIEKLK